ncbi:MAG TPA: hypothetical protein VMX13_13660 [Sedimentisphaerales bacterium]|nr:hypothetical protein [Sedimentisphaerales bacterium]
MFESNDNCMIRRCSSTYWLLVYLPFMLLYLCVPSQAQEPSNSERLLSSSVAQEFYEIAHELANSEDAGPAQIEQAITLMTASANLDPAADYVLPELIRLICRHPGADYANLMYKSLVQYVDKSVDLDVVRQAISYLLERLNSREDRERLFAELLKNLGGKNKVLDSVLATELGLLMAQKPDLQAAKFYFMQAYTNNKYNRLAFAKLAELMGDQIRPPIYLENLRLALGENPLDLQTALAFAHYAERLQLYQTAADAYEYCAELFRFLKHPEPLPPSIYLPWAISCYNTRDRLSKCLEIASDLRQSGRLDLLLEAVAARAAMKTGNTEEASRILRAAERSATTPTGADAAGGSQVSATQLAWFYCFALPDVNAAIEWANKAYSADPTSPTVAGLLAYALTMDGQVQWAKLLVDNYEHNQIAELAAARIQLTQGERGLAIETLKSAIAEDPGSLAAERAKQVLAEQGVEYLPPVDPDIVLSMLRTEFGQTIVPKFLSPEKIVSVQLQLLDGGFSYGSKFEGNVVITNHSTGPLLLSEEGLLKGNIRVDARITGDLDEQIPNLLSVRVRPASPINPGQSMLVPIRLAAGRLRQILLAHPQASLDIEFTVITDPAINSEGRLVNRFGIEPARLLVKRPGIELTRKYLQNRLESLAKGQQGQKIRTVHLFAGLLMEQSLMANRKPMYKFASAGWMPDLLRAALLRSLADEDWIVRLHTMVAMLSLPLDYAFIDSISGNLSDDRWPLRLMSTFLLAKSGDPNFAKVLDWTAKYDSNQLVRQMAVALGGTRPEQTEAPTSPPPAGTPAR